MSPAGAPAQGGRFNWRKLNNALHRDVGYLVVGLTIVYAVSGLAVNHRADWNPSYRTGRRTLRIAPIDAIRAVEDLMRTKTTGEWMAIFDRHGVPASPVWFVEEMLENPQVVENGYAVELEHDLTGPQEMAAPPLKMSDSPPASQGAAPPLGRDTRKWLKSVGWSDAQVDAAVAAGSVAEGP